MSITYLVKDKKIKEDLLKSHHKHKIEYEYPGEWYFVCTKALLNDINELKREKLEK